MNWADFKTTIREFLLVDSERKGRGVQNYINQLIRSGIIDLQRYVPELLTTTIESYRPEESVTDWSQTKQYALGDIVTNRDDRVNTKYGSPAYQAVTDNTDPNNPITEPPIGVNPSTSNSWSKVNVVTKTAEGAMEGNFNRAYTKLIDIYIRRFPHSTNELTQSQYYGVREVRWEDRFKLLDGKTPQKSISFGDDGFVYAPELKADEKLLIRSDGENHFAKAQYFSGSEYDAEEVPFDTREAKAVAEYVKAHLQREVDKDLSMYKSHIDQYQKERQEIYRERREYRPFSVTDPYPVETAEVGPYQIN